MTVRLTIASMVLAIFAGACGDEPCPDGTSRDGDGSCAAPGLAACPEGFAADPEGCAPVLAATCAPGTRLSVGRTECVPVGVPAGGCASGLPSDGAGGCTPVLPAAPCGPGLVALPGETACHPVAACAAGRWGDIPIAATTQFVDGAYDPVAGGPSDGTELHPWTTVQAGVQAAATDAIVAITDGVYTGNVTISNRAVQIWGRCPGAVALVGSAAGSATIDLLRASGSAVRGVELRGGGGLSAALAVATSSNVVIEKVWVSSHPRRGIYASATATTPTTIAIRDSLVEAAHEHGVFLDLGSEGTIERTVVRDTESRTADSKFGRGIAVHSDAAARRGRLTLRGSVVERNRDVGVFMVGSDTTVEGTVIRDTRPQLDLQARGWGIAVQKHPTSRVRSTLILEGSWVAGNHDLGMLLSGSTATLRRSVIRDTLSHQPDLLYGHAIEVVPSSLDDEAASLEVEDSLFDRNRTLALSINGSSGILRRTIVRGTLPQEADDLSGRGVEAAYDADAGKPATLELDGCAIEDNRELGVLVSGSTGTIRDTVIRGTRADPKGSGGRALEVHRDPDHDAAGKVELVGSLLDDNEEVAVLVQAAELTVDRSVIRRTGPGAGGHGYGVVAVGGAARGVVSIAGSLIESSHGAGVLLDGADAKLTGTIVRGSAAAGLAGHGIVAGAGAGATLDNCELAGNAGAGAAALAGRISLRSTLFACNADDIHTSGEGVFEDRRVNGCGCGAVDECRATKLLAPPEIRLPAPLGLAP